MISNRRRERVAEYMSELISWCRRTHYRPRNQSGVRSGILLGGGMPVKFRVYL